MWWTWRDEKAVRGRLGWSFLLDFPSTQRYRHGTEVIDTEVTRVSRAFPIPYPSVPLHAREGYSNSMSASTLIYTSVPWYHGNLLTKNPSLALLVYTAVMCKWRYCRGKFKIVIETMVWTPLAKHLVPGAAVSDPWIPSQFTRAIVGSTHVMRAGHQSESHVRHGPFFSQND